MKNTNDDGTSSEYKKRSAKLARAQFRYWAVPIEMHQQAEEIVSDLLSRKAGQKDVNNFYKYNQSRVIAYWRRMKRPKDVLLAADLAAEDTIKNFKTYHEGSELVERKKPDERRVVEVFTNIEEHLKNELKSFAELKEMVVTSKK